MSSVSGEGFTVDDVVPQRWGAEDASRIDRWGQGDLLVPLRPTWIGLAGYDQVTGVTIGDGAAVGTPTAVNLPGEAACGVIVSQTCDVVTTGPGARHPFVQVSPVAVVSRSSLGNLDQLARWEIRDRVLLSPARATIDGLADAVQDAVFVADLRLSVPVSKSLLVGPEPAQGFTDEADLLTFAEHLGQKVVRPAIHDFVTDTARGLISGAIEQDKNDSAWWSQVDEVRVRCRPTRLKPAQVEFFVVHNVSGNPDAAVVHRWNRVAKQVQRAGRRVGIQVPGFVHDTARAFLAETLRQTIALHIPHIKRRTHIF